MYVVGVVGIIKGVGSWVLEDAHADVEKKKKREKCFSLEKRGKMRYPPVLCKLKETLQTHCTAH